MLKRVRCVSVAQPVVAHRFLDSGALRRGADDFNGITRPIRPWQV
jgi:hypothetical protein